MSKELAKREWHARSGLLRRSIYVDQDGRILGETCELTNGDVVATVNGVDLGRFAYEYQAQKAVERDLP